MKNITKAAWSRVHQKACDIVNASAIGDDLMASIHREQMFEILGELEAEFGPHPEFYDTRADYLTDPAEQMRLYRKALALARVKNDTQVIGEILESIAYLQEDLANGGE